MTKWPSSVPATPLMGQFEEGLPTQIVFSNMDVGPDVRRRRTTLGNYPITAEFGMTRLQVCAFSVFYDDTVKCGSIPFTWINPRTLATISVCFMEAPQFTAETFDWYKVSIKVEVLQ